MRLNENCMMISVTSSDTLSSLAQKYNTTVKEILTLNPNINEKPLTNGQQVCIPRQSICPIGATPYEIKDGDTLAIISEKFLTTVEQILKTNPGIDPYNLQAGQEICIFEEKPTVPTCPSMNIYVINAGDTLYSIAHRFGTTVSKLIDINPGIDPYNLTINQIICLPITPSPYIIVVNTEKKKLSLYKLGKLIDTYPVAVGKPQTPTPHGHFYIKNKQVDPGGPFGVRWMGLSQPHYGIHGTNRPNSVGTAASNGCIRLHKDDVEHLFSLVSVNTPVIII